MTIVDQIYRLFEVSGGSKYQGGALSHQQHALQAAALAEAEGAPDALVLAALLHDVGHLVERTNGALKSANVPHDRTGAAWLARFFGPDVTEPVGLHVEAKRYLCAVDPNYLRQLAPACVQRLNRQGGPLSRREVHEFQAEPYHRAALWLRRIDDRAKDPDRTVPDLTHYVDRLEDLSLSHYLERSLLRTAPKPDGALLSSP